MTVPGYSATAAGRCGLKRLTPWLIVALCALAYANAVPNGFVFDDLTIVRDNPRLDSWGSLGGLLTANYWGDQNNDDRLWRPLTLLSFWLEARIVGKRPWGFHLVNLLLHAAVSLFVWRLAQAVGLAAPGALTAAAAFALHPIHVEAVAGIVGRSELLAALFFLAATRAWIAWTRQGGAWLAVQSGLWLFLALGAKENAAVFPLIAALALWAAPPRGGDGANNSPPRGKALWAGATAVAFALVLYVALRVAVLGAARYEPPGVLPGLLYGVDLKTRALTAAAVFARYAHLLIWPMSLSADYSYDAVPLVRTWSNGASLAGLGLIGALSLGALVLRRRCPPAAFGLGFYLLAFSLTSNFVVPIKTLMAERLTYLPSVGAALALGAGFATLWRRIAARPAARKGLLAAAAAVALAWEGRTVARNCDWATNETLFASGARSQPRCARVHFNLGDVCRVDRQDYVSAINHYRRALEILSGDSEAWLQIGNCQYLLGRFDEAEQAYRQALALEPDNAGIRSNLRKARQRSLEP
jgi:hypothetical protein